LGEVLEDRNPTTTPPPHTGEADELDGRWKLRIQRRRPADENDEFLLLEREAIIAIGAGGGGDAVAGVGAAEVEAGGCEEGVSKVVTATTKRKAHRMSLQQQKANTI
jgi:hypothetical protein